MLHVQMCMNGKIQFANLILCQIFPMCSVYLKDENKITSAIAKSYENMEVLCVAIQLHYRIAVSR